MYIEKIPAEERDIITEALDGMFDKLDRTQRVLQGVWDEYFNLTEQQPITANVAVDIGDLIFFTSDALYNCLLEYALMTGSDFHGVEPYLKGCKVAMEARKV